MLQARGTNLLVLDEPTNHLDLPAIEQLEEALDSFGGTLLLVTHDRRMLETVRLTRRWEVDAGVVTRDPPGLSSAGSGAGPEGAHGDDGHTGPDAAAQCNEEQRPDHPRPETAMAERAVGAAALTT